ncbi:electron transfer flavoprotein subunit alpha/FixB family protein [Clostridium akagii]|uniref:electron transfer flavoprotein subunit alpha/FixB family protein n=1 Tax=Clostridium akagii TaxID=91623 RepID=UPI00047BA9D4|nr:FAD-binding protein [Clostridium akagii]
MKKIGAVVGATRPLVDAEIIDLRYQVGQTGRTISPKLYIALGISGAPQHICGMIKSSKVIAVNKDKDAEIFNYSDIGFVADVFDVLKCINKCIK